MLWRGFQKPKRLAVDTETLTEWLAKHCKMTYSRIDPLRVDVGRVADVMSINYAERRHALPLTFGLTEVTIATCEPRMKPSPPWS